MSPHASIIFVIASLTARPPQSAADSVLGVFEGRTPCGTIANEFTGFPSVNCEKIKWRLTLYRKPGNGAPSTFLYEGTRTTRRGTWRVAASGKGRTVYHLTPVGAGGPLSLYSVDDKVLILLDRDGRVLVGDAGWSYVLNRVNQSASQAHVTLRSAAGDTLPAVIYGAGERNVVLVGHGGYSTNAAWEAQARHIAAAGFRVLSFETRGAVRLRSGQETDCLYDAGCIASDVLVAVRYLRSAGAQSITVIGGSAGGGGAAQASTQAAGEIERLVLLAPMAIDNPERIAGDKLFITSRGDRNDAGPRLPGIQEQFRRAPRPKRLVVLEGTAHGQRMFPAPEGAALMREILGFLTHP